MDSLILSLIFLGFVVVVLRSIVRVVPQNTALIVERLGKYHATLEAGFHMLLPVFDKVTYKHSLKEFAVDVPLAASHYQG